jgi:ribosomal 50S subunit-associated protein YjgA (DUF615 family)
MVEQDKYLAQLRRELTKAQARLARAERERDLLLEQNAALRNLLNEHGISLPAQSVKE